MRPTGMLIGLGAVGSFFLASGAMAGSFAFETVLVGDGVTPVTGGYSYVDTSQVIAGNGGVVATVSSIDNGDRVITINQSTGNANALIVASTGSSTNFSLSQGPGTVYASGAGADFNDFYELSIRNLSGGQQAVTFIADDSNSDVGLFQASYTSGVNPGAIHYAASTSLILQPGGGSVPTSDIHYRVNTAGKLLYQVRDASDVQSIVRDGQTVVTDGALTKFNWDTATISGAENSPSKQTALAADGSAVFRAVADSQIGLYRVSTLSNPAGPVDPIVANVSVTAKVLGASNSHVLYRETTASNQSLYYVADGASPAALVTYGVTGPRTAVLTQGNRLAYYNPDGGGTGVATLEYKSGAFTATVAAETDTFTAGDFTYTITQLSTNNDRNTPVMLNDNGYVVFDALLSVADENDVTLGDVQALVAWDAASQTNRIVVQVDLAGDLGLSDQVTINNTGYAISGLLVDGTTGDAIDLAKDALSDDNWLAFTITYRDGANDYYSVVRMAIPEPAGAMSLVGLTGAMLLRRRRATPQRSA